ncbi:MAG: hypothetical protein M3004_05440, partial [Bacteroidota bacterium]|nr:hypothetical protein [Bacteroidota bacterium]
MINNTSERERIILTRMVFVYILCFLSLRFFINATPSHFLQPQLFLIQFDFTYWFLNLIHLPDVIIKCRSGAYLFDILLFSTCIIPIFFPLQRFYIICFTLLFIIYEIAYNMYIIHNAHPLTVM